MTEQEFIEQAFTERVKQFYEQWKALPPRERVGLELLISKDPHSFLAKRFFQMEVLAGTGAIEYRKQPNKQHVEWFTAHRQGKSYTQIAQDAGLDVDPKTRRRTKKQLQKGRSTVAKAIQRMEEAAQEWSRAEAEARARLGWQ
jgi:hypothetical protein